LLTPDDAKDLDLQEEALYCQHGGLEFISYPINDRSVPSSDSGTMELIDRLDNYLTSGKAIVVHCRQGIGRSGLIAAGLLIYRGVSFPEAIERVSSARQIPIPETPVQHAWIARFASTAQAEKQPARK
jgi:protein-tyrosine phosphatase